MATTTDPRRVYVLGLRRLADLLDKHPGLPLPLGDMLAPLDTAEAVEASAELLGVDAEYDADSVRCAIQLGGGVSYRVYAYHDFEATQARRAAEDAAEWVAKHGMPITAQVTV